MDPLESRIVECQANLANFAAKFENHTMWSHGHKARPLAKLKQARTTNSVGSTMSTAFAQVARAKAENIIAIAHVRGAAD